MRPSKDMESVVRMAFKERHYVPNVVFRAFAEKDGTLLSYGSSRNLVSALWQTGLMQSAGRGWSTICTRSKFDYVAPVEALSAKLGEWFPYAESRCWSTRQLVNFFHHLPGMFYTYVYIDRSVMEQLRDRLEAAWPKSRVFVNPSAASFLSSRKSTENFVIRPITRGDENDGGKVLSLEGILVDFASEAELIVDEWDYKEIVRGAMQGFSVNAQAILRRISRRRR